MQPTRPKGALAIQEDDLEITFAAGMRLECDLGRGR